MKKIQFKAALALIGMSELDLAYRAQVDPRSVRRWTSEVSPTKIPQGIIDEFITPELERQERAVETAIQIVENQTAQYGEPKAVLVPWYRNDAILQTAHPGDARTYKMANADSVRLYSALVVLGYNAVFANPSEIPSPLAEAF